jgi:L-amino acid N-acyltransferase YncA
MLRFVPAEEENIADLLILYNSYISNTTITFDHEAIGIDEFRNRISFCDSRYPTQLVCVGEQLAGFGFLAQYRAKPAYCNTAEIGIYLKEDFTGMGLGGKIIDHLENAAKGEALTTIIASISGENNRSLSLFSRMGYRQCAHYRKIASKFGRKLDIIDFQKEI